MNVNATKTALVSALAADSTLTGLLNAGTAGIYDSHAPQGATPPYVVFQRMSGVPARVFGRAAWDAQVWAVKGITTGGSRVTGGSIAARVDAVLDEQTLTISGASNMACQRIADIEYPEDDNGVQYHHIGGQYKLWIA